MKGLLDPTTDVRTVAKDTVFELEMLNHCRAAGLQANLAEPDIEFRIGSSMYTFACKCLYSAGNVEKQFKKARNQIVKRGLPGIIALNISAITDHSRICDVDSEASYEKAIANAAYQFKRRHARSYARWIGKGKGRGNVMGVLVVLDSISRWSSSMQLLFVTKMIVQSPFPATDTRTANLTRVYECLNTRVV